MRSFNINENKVHSIEALYVNSSSAAILNNQTRGIFRIMVGIWQGCMLLLVLLNIFLETTIQDTLQDHHTSILMGGRHICNLRFANDINLLGSTNQELQDLTYKLVASTGACDIEVSTQKSKIMVNRTNNCSTDIHMNSQKLEEVDKFKYLGSTLSKDSSSSAEVHTGIDTASSAMASLDRVWKCNKISFPTKFSLYKSLVISILLYGCETWTLLADSEKRIQVFKNKCLRRLL